MERDTEPTPHQGGGEAPTEGGRWAGEQTEESLNPQADTVGTPVDRGRQMEGAADAGEFSAAVGDVIPLGPAEGDSGVEHHSAEYESETWDD